MNQEQNNRIRLAFERCGKENRPARIIYLTSGYPDLENTVRTVVELEKAGVDIVEIGFPFSDPMADGPVIQATTLHSLRKGYKTDDHFASIGKLRKKCGIPLAIMTYVNIVHAYGTERFIRRAAEVGVDGLIIPDLPLEEAGVFRKACSSAGLVTVFFASTTSSEKRLDSLVQAATGFIYVVSQPGVTGKKLVIKKDLSHLAQKIRCKTTLPLAVGFGIESRKDVLALSRFFDGIIIGSAFLKRMMKEKGKTKAAIGFVKALFG